MFALKQGRVHRTDIDPPHAPITRQIHLVHIKGVGNNHLYDHFDAAVKKGECYLVESQETVHLETPFKPSDQSKSSSDMSPKQEPVTNVPHPTSKGTAGKRKARFSLNDLSFSDSDDNTRISSSSDSPLPSLENMLNIKQESVTFDSDSANKDTTKRSQDTSSESEDEFEFVKNYKKIRAERERRNARNRKEDSVLEITLSDSDDSKNLELDTNTSQLHSILQISLSESDEDLDSVEEYELKRALWESLESNSNPGQSIFNEGGFKYNNR